MRFAYFVLPSLALALPVVNEMAGQPNFFNDLNKLGGQATKDLQKGAQQYQKGATQLGNQGVKEFQKGAKGLEKGYAQGAKNLEKGYTQALKGFKIPGIKTVDNAEDVEQE